MSHKREELGIQILAKGNIECINESTFSIVSQSNPNKTYKVEWSRNYWQCECPDFQQRKKKCKHVHSILYYKMLEDIRLGIKNNKNSRICPICRNQEDIVKRGKRYNRTGIKQLYYCKKCEKHITFPY